MLLKIDNGGSIRSNLLELEAAVLGRRFNSGDEFDDENWTGGALVGSRPYDDERDDTRESGSISGDRGGAMPVMQSMTRVRGVRTGAAGDSLLALRLNEASLLRSSSRVAFGWHRRSTRWMVAYV